MAIRAITTVDTVKYVSDADPSKVTKKVPVDPSDATKGTRDEVTIDEPNATFFTLAPLDAFLSAHIYDNASSLTGRQGSEDVKINTRVNQTNLDAVRFGLKGWTNFVDAKGQAAVFKTSKTQVNGRDYVVASDETIKLLGLKLVGELAGEIKRISEVSSDEEKNSETGSSQSD